MQLLNATNATLLPAAAGLMGVHLPVAAGTHHLSHDNAGVVFGASLSGHVELESYSYPAGMRVQNILQSKIKSKAAKDGLSVRI